MRYNGDNSYLFLNGQEIINFQVKDSETMPYQLRLRNISKDFDLYYMKKTGLSGYVYGFSLDYWAIANDKALDIYNYLMKKNNTV